jgi:hypothetical protein
MVLQRKQRIVEPSSRVGHGREPIASPNAVAKRRAPKDSFPARVRGSA